MPKNIQVHIFGVLFLMLFYLMIWDPQIGCTTFSIDPYVQVEQAIKANRFQQLTTGIITQAGKAVDADVTAMYLKRQTTLTLVASTDPRSRNTRGVTDTTQNAFYTAADDRGCVPIYFLEVSGRWARYYQSLGVNNAVLCSVRSKNGSMDAVLAIGYTDQIPDFNEVFTALDPFRSRLTKLLNTSVEAIP